MFGNFMSFFMHKHTVNLTEHAMYLDTVILGVTVIGFTLLVVSKNSNSGLSASIGKFYVVSYFTSQYDVIEFL